MGIREFVPQDIPQVAELHREAMGAGPVMSPQLLTSYQQWLTDTFLTGVEEAGDNRSLVYDDGGELVGFLGVVARQVSLAARVYRAAAGSNFCVRSTSRGRIGMSMAREFLARSRDLAFIDELTDRTRPLWDHFGLVEMPQSTRWTLALRPSQTVLSLVKHRIPRIARLARPLVAAVDGPATRLAASPFRYLRPDVRAEELEGPELARLLTEFGDSRHLRPVTADGSTERLLARAGSMRSHGELQSVVLRSESGSVLGWYIYYSEPRGVGEVLQLVATKKAAVQVLEHLGSHASERGVTSLSGMLDRTFLSALAAHWAVFTPAPTATRWLMVHSPHPELLEAYWRDRVLLSRLDGEWTQHFEP